LGSVFLIVLQEEVKGLCYVKCDFFSL